MTILKSYKNQCCSCGVEVDIDKANIYLLDFEGPTPGKGWGCAVCDLPLNGAIAIRCNDCAEVNGPLTHIVSGYLEDHTVIPLEGYTQKSFKHDRSKHPEMTQPGPGVTLTDNLTEGVGS